MANWICSRCIGCSERWLTRRTAVINQIRGLLSERGITLRKGRCHVDAALPGILEDASAKLSGALRMLLAQLKLELDHLEMRIDEADAVIKKTARENEACQRLDAIPGIRISWRAWRGPCSPKMKNIGSR